MLLSLYQPTQASGSAFAPLLGEAGLAEVKKTDDEMRKLVIGSILIVGNVSISSKDIKFKVRSRVGDLFDPEKADEDAKRIAELAGIEFCYHRTDIVDNKVKLTFVVRERDIVRSIVFVGNRKYKDKTLRKKLGLGIGDRLDELISAESGRLALKQLYLKVGFAFVQVTLDSEQLRKGKLIYTIDEGSRVKIEKVKLSGKITVKAKMLKKAIKTNKKKRFLWPRYYNEGEVAEDVERLKGVYWDRGFLDPNITEKTEFNADKSKVRLTFAIEEGPRYTIEKIDFIGNERFDDERLRAEAELELKPGQSYSERKTFSDAARLRKFYREEGFIDVEVRYLRPKFVPDVNAVNVEFEIFEGEQFRIGRLDITGNERTQDKVVRRVLDEYDFQPGKWYNADVAPVEGGGELEEEIRGRVLAEAASIRRWGKPYGYSPDKDVWITDAEVNIKEGKTGAWNLGGGVSSDSGIIGQVVLEQRNFDIKDWPQSFGEFITGKALKGAGQTLRIALQPGVEISQYSVSFTEPYFRDKPTALNVIGQSYEREFESYDLGRLKAYVGFEERYQKRYRERWRKSIGFRVENVDVDSVHSNAPTEIQSVKGTQALAGIKLGVKRELIDNRFRPSTGYSFSTGYEQLGGDYTFGILSGAYRRYKTLYKDLTGRKTILAMNLLAATVIGDAPPFEKFYAGGTGYYGIRGFDYRGVSTRAGVDKDPVGSDWIFLANVEVTVPLVGEEFAALFFVDSGAIDSGNYRVAVGTGIQILIPRWFGHVPMRLEIAAPLMRDDADDMRVFSFSVGRLF